MRMRMHTSRVTCRQYDVNVKTRARQARLGSRKNCSLKLEVGRARVEVGRTRVEVGGARVEVGREKRVTLLGHGTYQLLLLLKWPVSSMLLLLHTELNNVMTVYNCNYLHVSIIRVMVAITSPSFVGLYTPSGF